MRRRRRIGEGGEGDKKEDEKDEHKGRIKRWRKRRWWRRGECRGRKREGVIILFPGSC